MMRVLVIDGGDFVAQRVLGALAACDWAEPVAAQHGRGSGRGQPLPELPGVRTLALDVTSAAAVGAALDGIDAVVSCIASDAATISFGALALFAAAERCAAPPRVVHLSSMAVYGSATGVVDESAPLRGDLGPYSQAKVAAEGCAAAYPRSVILRPGVDYGPGSEQWSGRIGRWLQARRIGDLGAAGDGPCNLVHGDDVVAAVLQCLQRPGVEGRVFNLGSPQPPTWNEYLVRYARALGAVPVRRIAASRLRFEARVLAPPLKIVELAARKAGIDPRGLPAPIPPSLLGLLAQDIRLVVRRAEQELGLQWKPLATGLAETAQWLRGTQ